MAHVVPKREPCRKCNNPVFLAERLVINQTLYHRTCFRCARCNTILSVGYFYETEKDHEYCCEQCPDEEKKPAGPKVESNRLSIAQKIALFEKDSSSVLRKSLSDEEKSKSLKRQSPANSGAFNSFLATQITEAKPESSDDDDEKTLPSSDSDSDDDAATSDKKIRISDHKTVPDNSVATKEFRGKDIEAIAKTAQKQSESHVVGKDNALDDKKVQKVPYEIDDIELEFDKLVEEAEKSISVDVPDVKTEKSGKKINKNEEKPGKMEENIVKINESKVKNREIGEKIGDNSVKFGKIKENSNQFGENSMQIDVNFVKNSEKPVITEEKSMKIKENSNMTHENLNQNIENSKSSDVNSWNIEKKSTKIEYDQEKLEEDQENCENLEDKFKIDKNFKEIGENSINNQEISEKLDDNTGKFDDNSGKFNENSGKLDENSRKLDESFGRLIENGENLGNFDENSGKLNEKSSNINIINKNPVIIQTISTQLQSSDENSEKILDKVEQDLTENVENPEAKENEIPRIFVQEATVVEKSQVSESVDKSVEENSSKISEIPSENFDSQAEINSKSQISSDFSRVTGNELLLTDESSIEKSNSRKIEENSVENQEKLETNEEEKVTYPDDLNPFGDDEEPEESPKPVKRPSLNPFGSEDEDEDEKENSKSMRNSGTLPKPPRPPPPKTMTMKTSTNPFGSDEEEEEEEQKPAVPHKTPVPTPRKIVVHSTTPEPSPRSLSNHNSPGHSFKGSTSSLASSSDGMSLRRKKKAPAPPPPKAAEIKTPASTPRKKRPAPTPPTSTPKSSQDPTPSLYITANDFEHQSNSEAADSISTLDSSIEQAPRRLIPLEECLVEEKPPQDTEEVVYRRKIVPLSESFDNLEQSKDNKEAQNRQRQSQGSMVKTESESTDSLPYLNKSTHGKWKRRKGPAPSIPGFATPQRRILQMLPLQEIRQELEVIEVQQQGLEKQGVMLEKMIRERCEGNGDNRTTEELLEALPNTKNPKEVEELILQLFELVNEKNELFRRQAELMYLRRAHRLEEEQADVEYEIRTLMAQPEQNKTDSDKTKEEALIARLVEIVQLRNEVVDCLDRDRLREAEEDLSIKQRMESHTAKMDQDYLNQTPTKLSKKEKKKLKEAKKLKNKKLDADKDLDTSEMKSETSEKKKKKKKFLF